MSLDTEDFLAHYGVRGMRWGVRKKQEVLENESLETTKLESKKHKQKTAKIVLGSLAGTAVLLGGAYFIKRHLSVNTKDIKPQKTAIDISKKLVEEPVSIIHATRGRKKGFVFLRDGGISDPLKEYDKSGLNLARDGENFFRRYGDRNEKVAIQFMDPKGRKDQAGRVIPHAAILPESLSVNVKDHTQAVAVAWPLVEKIYDVFYDS